MRIRPIPIAIARPASRLLLLAQISLIGVGLAGSGCVEDRMVDVVASAMVVVPIVSRGIDNTWDETLSVDLASDVDLDAILRDNNLEPGTVRARLESLSYRVTRKDPTPARTISGTITVSDSLLADFAGIVVDDPANEDWVPMRLTKAGTDQVNSTLDAYLATRAPAILTFRTRGTSTPVDVPTDFAWEIRLKIGVVGKMKISVFEPF